MAYIFIAGKYFSNVNSGTYMQTRFLFIVGKGGKRIQTCFSYYKYSEIPKTCLRCKLELSVLSFAQNIGSRRDKIFRILGIDPWPQLSK
jgi:amino acid permease